MKPLQKPVITSMDEILDLISHFEPGAITLVENSSSFGGELVISTLVEYSKKKAVPLVVEDIFDTLPLFLTHLKLLGTQIDESQLKVIKVGGTQEVGNILGRISFERDSYVYKSKLEEELKKIRGKGPYIHLVVGLERFLAFQRDLHGTYSFLSTIKEKLGDDEGINIHLVETSVLGNLEFNPLPILEDIATSVVELEDNGDLMKVILKKSVLTLLMNKGVILISPKEVLRWWV